MKQLINVIVPAAIIAAVVWFSWDSIIEYIPIVQSWISGLFGNLKGVILSVLPMILLLFIFFSFLNDN